MREQQTQPGGKHVVVVEQEHPGQEVKDFLSNFLFFYFFILDKSTE